MATNIFLDQAGLSYYDSKIKAEAAGTFTISGRTITLKSIAGTTIGTVEIPQTIYQLATSTEQGLMSPIQFVKLEGISEGATKTAASGTNGQIIINDKAVNVYVHPTANALSSGLYKITTNAEGHVTAGTAVSKSDITALGIPAQDTTYTAATSSKDGLMTSAQVGKLNGIATNAQVNVLEKVSVNGSALPISSKGVNIDLSGYALKTDISTAVNYKGSVDTYKELPTGAKNGDMYNVVAEDKDAGIAAGTNVIWNGTSWDPMAPLVVISSIPTSEIDKLFA